MIFLCCFLGFYGVVSLGVLQKSDESAGAAIFVMFSGVLRKSGGSVSDILVMFLWGFVEE